MIKWFKVSYPAQAREVEGRAQDQGGDRRTVLWPDEERFNDELSRLMGGPVKLECPGVVYQNFWMRKHGIQPLPLWLVGWFVIPLESFRAWRQRKRDGDIPF